MTATTTTVVTAVLGGGLVALLVALMLVRRRAAAEGERRQRLEAELRQARTDVVSLNRRLDSLAEEVVEARKAADRAAGREFVITSLSDPSDKTFGGPDTAPIAGRAGHRAPGTLLEEKLVQVASRSSGSSSAVVATRLAVSATALGHGIRRALSPEVLDRAAAAATVARRRSRRDRKREVREARRMLRTVQDRAPGKHVA